MFDINSTTVYLLSSLLGCVLLYYGLFVIRNFRLIKFAYSNNGFYVPILPFVGTVYLGLFTGDKLNLLSTARLFKKLFGFPCSCWMGYHYLLFNDHPEEIKVIVNHPKCMDKPIPFYENFEVIAKNSVFLLAYDKWRVRRKHFMKSYRPKVLKTYQQTFYKQSCDLVEELKKQKNPENLFDVFNRYSFINFFRRYCQLFNKARTEVTSVGLEEEKVDRKQMHEFGQILDEIQALATIQILDPVTPIRIWLLFFPSGRRTAELIKASKIMVGNIIAQKKKQYVDFQAYTENTNEMPLMDSLLYMNGKKMSDEEIFEEMVLFSAAATETSGNVMAFCFTCLGMYPDVQEALYNEVMALVGYRAISSDDLLDLKYTEAVIMETLRFFPALPLVGRYINADIDVGTRIIPQGTNYVISLYHLHRNPKYWENPLKFDPTRFLPGKMEKIQPYSYMPFCGGPRDCIGKTQAMILMKTTLVNIIRNFKLTSHIKSLEDIKLSSCLTMKATHSLRCNFISRQD